MSAARQRYNRKWRKQAGRLRIKVGDAFIPIPDDWFGPDGNLTDDARAEAEAMGVLTVGDL